MREDSKTCSTYDIWDFIRSGQIEAGEYAIRISARLRIIVEYDASNRTAFVKEVSDHYGD